ncbi:MAG: DUF922 domain-containing protein [Anaerolineae bacterium]|nr:DUF922 domain-containing protein [Anaerolineae bacterium]
MRKQSVLIRKRIKKRRRSCDEGQIVHPATSQSNLQVELATLQQHIGNQAMQQVLTKRSGHGSLTLDQDSLLRLTQKHGSVQQAIASQVAAQAGVVQRDKNETAQVKANTGTVTIETVTRDDYDVEGSTLEEVAKQLDPKEWGRCTYHYDYSYETLRGRTTKVDITLKLTILLPRWTGEGWKKASSAAKKAWQRMMTALEKHENGHADIARKWAPVFKQRLLKQRENRLQTRFNQTLRKVKKENKQYDQKTKHGQNEGVTLDISIK